jgi:hypothetical protein
MTTVIARRLPRQNDSDVDRFALIHPSEGWCGHLHGSPATAADCAAIDRRRDATVFLVEPGSSALVEIEPIRPLTSRPLYELAQVGVKEGWTWEDFARASGRPGDRLGRQSARQSLHYYCRTNGLRALTMKPGKPGYPRQPRLISEVRVGEAGEIQLTEQMLEVAGFDYDERVTITVRQGRIIISRLAAR